MVPKGFHPRSTKSQAADSPSEVELLRLIRHRAEGFKSPGLRLGIGDDCAILRPRPDEEIVVTTDLSLEGRHFRLDMHPPESVGHRTLARGLSDLAAMGARPLAAFLSLAVPPELTRNPRGRKTSHKSQNKSWTTRFYDGLFKLAAAHKTPLAGGDLAQFPQVVADIMLVGAVRHGKALLRNGARPGDLLYVTGSLGGSAAGLRRLEALAGKKIPASLEAFVKPHLWPEPRIAQGQWLARHGTATAAMDLSDGPSIDLARLCEESGIHAEIDAAALPVYSSAGFSATLEEALHGGEDYELLFTAPVDRKLPRSIAGVPITQIGRIVRKSANHPPVTLLTTAGIIPLEPQGWQHFA